MNSDAAQMLLAVRIGLRAATHSFNGLRPVSARGVSGLLKGPLWVR